MITTRSAALTHFKQLAHECGLNANALVMELGLPVRALTDADLMVPAHLVAQLLEVAAERAREPAFGLRMAALRRLSNLGPLGLLLRDQPTLRQALDTLIARLHLHNEAVMLATEESDHLLFIRCDVLLERDMERAQAIDAAMGTTFRIVQALLGNSWQPQQVRFRRHAPGSTEWYRRVFGPSLQFGCERNEIVCYARDLDVPAPGADPVMAAYAQRLLSHDLGPQASTLDRVRQLVVLLLPRGLCSADVVAQNLGVSRRTIDTHLAAEGTTFKAVVDRTRRELLNCYLREKSHTLSEIAPLLGFSELSALSRWHRHQFGASVTQRLAQPRV
ncbi:MAG TPA: AraC family transcriptional regulator [Burkholderiaceae bacterium]|nr:AraC family transcriptional regulator [Burkholderiaceae bacterium]